MRQGLGLVPKESEPVGDRSVLVAMQPEWLAEGDDALRDGRAPVAA